jgi:hypothetical protein
LVDAVIPRVWLKAFWGFDPGNEGYLGFTRSGDRNSFLEEARPGDLVLIYGADTAETAAEDRRQALGFLEVEPVPISDRDRISAEGLKWKLESGWGDRWTFAVPVTRAWRVNRRIEVKHIAPTTYIPARARVIAARGELMTSGETGAVSKCSMRTRSPRSAGAALGWFWWSSPTRLFAGWLAYWALRYELRSVPARDEIADAGHPLMHERFVNRKSLSMCHACDMEQPTRDDTWLESLVFISIF